METENGFRKIQRAPFRRPLESGKKRDLNTFQKFPEQVFGLRADIACEEDGKEMRKPRWWMRWGLGLLLAAGNLSQGEESAPTGIPVRTRPGAPGVVAEGSPDLPEAAADLTRSTYFNQGVQLYQAGQLEAARAKFETVLKVDPQNVTALCWLGCILLQQGQVAEAMESLERATLLDPKYALAHNNLALAYLGKGLPEAALQHYRKALECDPQYADAYFNLANLYSSQKKFPEALRNYQKAIQLLEDQIQKRERRPRPKGSVNPPENPQLGEALREQLAEYYNNLGRTYQLLFEERRAQGQSGPAQQALRKALEAYTRATQRAPRRALFFFNLGLVQWPRGPDHIAEAIPPLEQALVLYPQDPAAGSEGFSLADIYLHLGMAYAETGRFQEAERAFLQVQTLQPQQIWGYFHLAKLYARQKDLNRAEETYLRALDLRPNDPVLLHNLGCVYFQMRRWDDAIAHFQQALQGQPEEALTHTNLALAYQQKGLTDQARREWQWVVDREPANAPARVALADLYFRQQDYHEAEMQYRQALELGIQDAGVFTNMGVIYLERNELGLAEASFKRALKLEPRNPRAYYNLGICYEHRGNKAKAMEMYQKALEIDPGYEDARLNWDRLKATPTLSRPM
jgi:tetratricopeptide (TPR) repeat protein